MSVRKRPLRSQRWFGPVDYSAMGSRGLLKGQGWPEDLFDGRPVIGICNSWSELSPCNAHLRDLAEAVKRGVWEAGGFPLEFPVSSVGETLAKPTAMLFRNLISMDVEEYYPFSSDGRRCATMRLRQVYSSASDGCGECGSANNSGLKRPDAERPFPWAQGRIRHSTTTRCLPSIGPGT